MIQKIKSRIPIKFGYFTLSFGICRKNKSRIKLFDSACDRLDDDLDILAMIKSLQKSELLGRLLLTNIQLQLVPQIKENVVEAKEKVKKNQIANLFVTAVNDAFIARCIEQTKESQSEVGQRLLYELGYEDVQMETEIRNPINKIGKSLYNRGKTKSIVRQQSTGKKGEISIQDLIEEMDEK